jgi:PhoD-like phosphatase
MASTSPAQPVLVVGPLLRYVGTTTATVWVETDRAAEVEVLGQRARTFHVLGHHYALVVLEGLEPGSVSPYEVTLDGVLAWPPEDGRPGPAIHTREGERQARLVFGSCRVGAPQTEPYTRPPTEDSKGFGIDALWAYSRRLQTGEAAWPDGLLLLGDQVYADEVPPETLAFIEQRRSTAEPPGEAVANFEEYTQLYRESWSDPDIRWLLATVPSTMIFDDHELSDDWNISQAWVEEMRALPWWDERVTGAFMTYWLYQHLGNLSPPELAEEVMFEEVRGLDDAGPRLRTFARMCDRESAANRWAYYRDFGRSRLLVIDSRAARVLVDGRRDMVDSDEWEWIVDHARGSFDHLIIATSLPAYAPPGIHYLEAWNEAVCHGRWGSVAGQLGERLRRGVDLEHWAAFQRSFETLNDLLREVSRGFGGTPPVTIVVLSGDVHTTYAAEVELGADAGSSKVFQVVCSPFRNPLSPHERRLVKATGSSRAAVVFSLLARAAGVRRPTVSWRYIAGRTFDNSIGELVLDEEAATLTLYRALPAEESGGLLEPSSRHDLAR